jgi:hypothetical protein
LGIRRGIPERQEVEDPEHREEDTELPIVGAADVSVADVSAGGAILA